MAHAIGLLLGEYDDIEVVAELTDAAGLAGRIAEAGADVVLVDPEMPSLDLEAVANEVSAAAPGTSLVVMTTSSTRYVDAAVDSSAHGYVSLDASTGEVIGTLRLIAAGQVAATGPAVDTLSDLVEAAAAGESRNGDPLGVLSPREREVAGLVARGLSNREIGDQMEISENTIKVHLRNVFQKTGVRTRSRLAAQIYAANQG